MLHYQEHMGGFNDMVHNKPYDPSDSTTVAGRACKASA